MIKKSIISYLSIIFFTAVGIALYGGMCWGIISFEQKLTNYYQDNNFYPYMFTSPLGLDNNQIEEIKNIDEIDDAQGYNVSYQKVVDGAVVNTLAVVQFTDRINTPDVVQGTLPKTDNEIMVGSIWANSHNVKLGETIRFEEEAQLCKHLNNYEYKVVAIGDDCGHMSSHVNHLGYSIPDGEKLSGVVYVTEDAFNKNLYKGYSFLSVFSNRLFDYDLNSEKYDKFTENVNNDICFKLEAWHTDKEKIYNLKSSAKPMVSLSVAHSVFNSIADIVNSSNNTTSPIFIVIGVLIVFSTISRSVSSSVIHIGTKKALGFFGREIRLQYVGFSLSSAIIGLATGLVLGYIVIQPLVAKILASQYVSELVGNLVFDISPFLILIITELVVVILISILSCNHYLKKDTVDVRVKFLGNKNSIGPILRTYNLTNCNAT